MSTPIVVVGSGASALHFTLSALERGREVVMLDVGREQPAAVLPDASLNDLKDQLDDPIAYFLGKRFESVLYPGAGGEYYGIPPSKSYVFFGVERAPWSAKGFEPLSSFARGGLAEAWTGGSYPFNDAELSAFPFSFADISPYYDLIAERIGISGAIDDLAKFMPVHRHLMPPLDLDEHSRVLAAKYEQSRAVLNERQRCYVGRSRIAAISRDMNDRRACSNLGRCLWGCPTRSLYTPSLTLDACRRFPAFRYHAGVYVRRFTIDARRRISSVIAERISDGVAEEIPVDSLVLGAGALSSCRILLESVYRWSGETIELTGLMDNQQVLMPFVNLSMLTRRFNPDSYQYHQLGLGLESARPEEYVHGQITTLKTALIHPIVQRLPFDMKTSLSVFRNLHAALGLVNINLHDTRRSDNRIQLEVAPDGSTRLLIHYETGPSERDRAEAAIRRVKRALRALNCIVPPGMTHTRPMGASVHYAGLLPMSSTPQPWTTSPDCQSHDFENLWIVDGATFPFLPAKNLTFTLMANAARVAARAF